MLKISEIRKEKGISQKELAKLLNVSPGNLCEWEKGRIEPNIFALKRLADIFECSVDYLIGREDDLGYVNIIDNNNNLNLKEKELVDNYRKLSILEQDTINTQIKALANKNKNS